MKYSTPKTRELQRKDERDTSLYSGEHADPCHNQGFEKLIYKSILQYQIKCWNFKSPFLHLV